MNTLLTAYVLVWPVAVAASLLVMCRAFYLDVKKAREAGEQLV